MFSIWDVLWSNILVAAIVSGSWMAYVRQLKRKR